MISIIRRFSGVAGVAILWSATVLAMRRGHVGLVDSRPLSYLGVNPSTAQLFSVGLLASSALFICFAFYVMHAYRTNNRFLVYFLIGQVGQIIAAVTPYGQKSGYRLIHTLAAYTLAFSLPFLIREFARSQKSGHYHRLYRQLTILEIIAFVIGIGIFTTTHGIAPLGEALPAIGFHVWIIAVTLTTPAANSRAN